MDDQATPVSAEAPEVIVSAAPDAPAKGKAKAAPDPEPEAPAPHPIEEAIEEWLHSHLHNSPVSRLGAEAWNHLLEALDALKAKLKEL